MVLIIIDFHMEFHEKEINDEPNEESSLNFF